MNTLKTEFKIKVVSVCMILAIITLLLGTLSSCNKYLVMSYLKGNLYHIHNDKTKKSEIILTNDTLILGKEYKLKEINIIDSPYYKPKKQNKMSELKITGNITKVLELQKGVSKATGKEWQKLNFLVQTDAEYNNYYYFEIFGEDKIENFNKWNKVGSKVTVGFNVKTNEFNGKYYTSLVAWNIFNEFKDAPTDAEKERAAKKETIEEDGDDLPF